MSPKTSSASRRLNLCPRILCVKCHEGYDVRMQVPCGTKFQELLYCLRPFVRCHPRKRFHVLHARVADLKKWVEQGPSDVMGNGERVFRKENKCNLLLDNDVAHFPRHYVSREDAPQHSNILSTSSYISHAPYHTINVSALRNSRWYRTKHMGCEFLFYMQDSPLKIGWWCGKISRMGDVRCRWLGEGDGFSHIKSQVWL